MNASRRAVAIVLFLGLSMAGATWVMSQPPPYQQLPLPYQGPPGSMPVPPPGPILPPIIDRQPIPQPPVPGQSAPPAQAKPKLEPLAETKLLMEGLAQANFRGLERILKAQPEDNKAWAFARGQSLLLAETSNLLMLRPPRNQGEGVWYQRSAEFRDSAMALAQSLSQKDYQRSRAAFLNVAVSCNRCHQSFRVPAQIKAFE